MKKTKTITPDGAKLPGRTWFNLCLFGFIGQVAWNLENMYYNTFMYNTVYEGGTVTGTLSSMDAITLMVNLSAVTAVITTFIMGNLSDKMNKRKVFISIGYLIWGVITGAFGFLTKGNISSAFGITEPAMIVTATAVSIIVMDCIMTFVGSTSNDSAFNAWVTDVTTTKNRATAESILAILPIAATVIVMLSGGLIETFGKGNTEQGYKYYFLGLGALVFICGILGLFTLKDSRSGEKQVNTNYWKDLFYGFKPSVIKENSKLYIALTAVGIYSIAVQIFFPFLFIYLDHGLGFNIEALFGYITTPVLIVAPFILGGVVLGIIAIGKFADRVGKKNLVFIAAILFIVGLFAASFAKTMGPFGIAAIPLLAGYGLLGILLNSTVRDYTPEDKTGLFQGIRMIFFVLLPMIIGPQIGKWTCTLAGAGSYVDESTGMTQAEPCAEMFLAAAIVAVFVLIPLVILRKKGIDKVEG
ncbi:MAG: MFS transporter [Clostridia bacterium]|nr:MFS transporter [Clostridia bacterium]